MAIGFCKMSMLKRLLIFVVPVLILGGCISSQPFPVGTPVAAPISAQTMRAPKVGQEWVYTVRNVFNQSVVDVITERVVSVGDQVRIERTGQKMGRLPDEIQSPWGYIEQDPHWNPPQKLLKPVPLWPLKLEAGWSGSFPSRYEVVGFPGYGYYWNLIMTAQGWERIKSPAGEFVALKVVNEMPFFESNDISRVASNRGEELWLSPEIGRWVIRRSSGRYLWGGMNWSGALWEDYLEWELVSWK
jgi:hypothetical protein